MNIPQQFRDKIASSVVGTPGVDPSGQMIGQEVAQGAEQVAEPIWNIAEKQQAARDEAQYNMLMLQHNMSMASSLEKIKVQYSDNPDAAGPAMLNAIKGSLDQATQQATNPRVKLMAATGSKYMEAWSLKEAYQWSSQQEYNNIIKGAKSVMDASGQRLSAVGADTSLSAADMLEKVKPEAAILASGVQAIRNSKHQELADDFEKSGMQSNYKWLLDSTMEHQPTKTVELINNPEVAKYFKPDEVKKYQDEAAKAVMAFPVKQMEQNISQDLISHAAFLSDVTNGKLGYAEIDAAQKMDVFGWHPETYKYAKEIAMNVSPEASTASRDEIRATFFNEASQLGFKLNNDPTKLATKAENNKAIMSNNVKDLYKFQDDIISAQARGIISKSEADMYQKELSIPLVQKTLERHNPSKWNDFLNKAAASGTSPLATAAHIFHIGGSKKVDDFQTVSSIISEHLARTGQADNFKNKAAYMDAYFKDADHLLASKAINPKTNAFYTPADIAHAVVGEEMGGLYKTKFGLRAITGYDPKTHEPLIETTKEDDEALAMKASWAEFLKENK